MARVKGKVRVNRPFFFTDIKGERLEFPAHGIGEGELDGHPLSVYQTQVRGGAIEDLLATETADAPETANAPHDDTPVTITDDETGDETAPETGDDQGDEGEGDATTEAPPVVEKSEESAPAEDPVVEEKSAPAWAKKS